MFTPKGKTGAVRMARLTDAKVRSILAGDRRIEVPDGLVGSLYLIIQPSGAKSWAIRYRHRGGYAKTTLGSYPAISLAEARQMAREAFLRLANGEDALPNKASRAAPEADTVTAVVEAFLNSHARPHTKPSTAREIEGLFRRYVLPAWGARPIGSITRREIHELLDEIAARAPTASNRTLAAVKQLFTWALERDMVQSHPSAAIKPKARERPRDRVLTDQEIVAIWRGAEQLAWPFGRIVQLLILTAARRDEVAGMRWSELDIDQRLWSIARERRKNQAAHDVPLSWLALELLAALPHFVDDRVFPAQRATSDGFVSGFSKAKARLDALSSVADWRLHDLRRTCATGLQRLGAKLEVIEEILGHVSGSRAGVVGVYQRHRFEKEKRAALESWSRHIQSLLEPTVAEKLVHLQG
jgi:integrase